MNVRMKGLKFTKETSTIALVFFTVYFVYGLFYTPTLQYVISLAVGGIAYGITESYEIAVVALLAINYVFPMFRGSSMKGVTAYRIDEGFASNASADEVRKNIASMTGVEFNVSGVGSKTSEGFANADDDDLTLNENKKEKASENIAPTSKPAPASAPVADAKEEQLAKMTEMMANMMKSMNKGSPSPSKDDAFEDSKADKISEKVPVVHQPQEKETFADNSGLFKLGQIPADKKGGFHIDAGTTVMNAINSLKPDQIKAMTADTKQLIDTQKSLMSMLQTFQPMVSEGKQMMDTFQTMFAPTAGAGVMPK